MVDVADRTARQVLLIAVILVGIGVVMIYSSSSALAGTRFDNTGFFLERQMLRATLGLGLMFGLSRVPLQTWRPLARPLLIAGVGLLVCVLIFGEGKGAQRWLPFRIPAVAVLSFQPSEFVKLVLVLYLADVLVRREEEIGEWKLGLLPRLVVLAGVQLLIIMQPDLGTALAISAVAFCLLWIGGASTVQLLGALAAALPVIGLSLLTSPYQWQRLQSFFGPADPQGSGFQVHQSLLALGSGGVFGVGLGNSMQKYFLPEPHTDFVFAFVGEEVGLFGTLSVIGLFVALAIHGCRIALTARTYHGFLVATGITLMVGIYAILNVGVATGVMPTTGLPLPFLSYGGSSLLWNLGGVGILAAVARDSRSRVAMEHRARALVWNRTAQGVGRVPAALQNNVLGKVR